MNKLNSIIILFYSILTIYSILYIFNTLLKANLYTTSGFITFNSIFFGSIIIILFYAIVSTQFKLSKLF